MISTTILEGIDDVLPLSQTELNEHLEKAAAAPIDPMEGITGADTAFQDIAPGPDIFSTDPKDWVESDGNCVPTVHGFQELVSIPIVDPLISDLRRAVVSEDRDVLDKLDAFTRNGILNCVGYVVTQATVEEVGDAFKAMGVKTYIHGQIGYHLYFMADVSSPTSFKAVSVNSDGMADAPTCVTVKFWFTGEQPELPHYQTHDLQEDIRVGAFDKIVAVRQAVSSFPYDHRATSTQFLLGVSKDYYNFQYHRRTFLYQDDINFENLVTSMAYLAGTPAHEVKFDGGVGVIPMAAMSSTVIIRMYDPADAKPGTDYCFMHSNKKQTAAEGDRIFTMSVEVFGSHALGVSSAFKFFQSELDSTVDHYVHRQLDRGSELERLKAETAERVKKQAIDAYEEALVVMRNYHGDIAEKLKINTSASIATAQEATATTSEHCAAAAEARSALRKPWWKIW